MNMNFKLWLENFDWAKEISSQLPNWELDLPKITKKGKVIVLEMKKNPVPIQILTKKFEDLFLNSQSLYRLLILSQNLVEYIHNRFVSLQKRILDSSIDALTTIRF